MRGFGERVRAGVKSTRVDPLQVQVKIDERSLHQAEQAARQAASNVAKARDVEKRASEDLRLAETRLADARKSSGASASQLVAAENRLNQAKRAAVSAASAVQRAHADEARSKSAVVAANDRLDASYRRLQRSTSGIAGAMRSVRGVMSNLGDNGSIAKTDRALSRASGSALKLAGTATVAATGLVGIGAATGPILALAGALASAAGSAALIPAALAGAGASFAAVKIGVSGISEAFKGYTADQDAAAKTSTKNAATELSNAKAIRSAKQAISDAQRDQARTARDGAEQVQAAHQRVSAAVEDEKLAQEDLQRAYKDSARELQDLWLARTGYSLDAESAQIAFERQQQRTDEIMRSSTATALDKREANNDLLQSQHRLFEAQERQKRGIEDYLDAEKKGVAGSDQVVAAQRRVKSAQDNVRDSKLDLARTERSAAEANQDAARRVSEAVQNLADTQSQQAAASDKATSATSKYNDALAKLSPNAQAFVRAVIGMREQWDALKRSVQDRLFAGTADEVRALGDKYLPILKHRLGDIAGSFNTAGLETSKFLRSAQGVRMVDTTLGNTSKTTDQLARAAAPLTNIFLRFSEIGSAYLPGLASKFADAAERAAAFVNSAEGTQKIKGWIEGGLQALSQLWQLLKNVGGIVGGVFQAMNTAGASTLQMLVDITGAARDWVNSAEGQRTLVTIFTTIRDVVNELKPGVAAVLGALKDAFLTLAPSLPGAARAFSNIAQALAPLVGWIAHALKWLIDEGLIPLGEWAKKHPGSFQAVAVAVLAVVGAIKALNMAKKVMDWATGIANAFGVIRRDADKASDSVGRDGKSGLRGRLGALKGIGKFTITIALVFLGLEIMHEVGEWIKRNNPGENKPQKDRTPGEEGAHVVGGVLASNPLDAFFKNDGRSPFEWFFGQTPDEFAESVKNSMFGKLSDKFDATIGTWLTDHISNPVKKFFSEDIPNWFSGIFGGEGGGQPPAQGALGGGGGGGSSFLSGLLPKEGVGTWMSTNVGTPISDFFTNLPSTIGGLSDSLGTWAETNIRQPVVNKFTEMKDGAIARVTEAKDWVVTRFTELKDGAIARITEAKDWVILRFTELKDWVILRATEAKDWVILRYTELKDWIILRATEAKDWVILRFTELKDWVILRATEAKDWVIRRYTELKDWIILRATEAKDWVILRFTELKDWIILRATEAKDWVIRRYTELKDWIILRATEAKDWVILRFTELKDWIITRATEARDWVNTRFRELKDWIILRATEAKDWVILRFTEMKDWIITRVTEAKDWVITRFTELKDGAIQKVTEAKDWVVTRATELKDGFISRITELVDNVGRKWDELKGLFERPIRWVIDTVWNGAIGTLWGKARALLPGLPEFQKFASGGSVRGPGTATSDSIPARLSDGEHVLTAREVKAAGGHGAVERWRRGLFSQNPAQFATGGPVRWNELWDAVRNAVPGARLNNAVRPGDPGEHGAGLAVDLSGPLMAINRWIAGAFPDSHELIYTPGVNLFNGRPHRYSGSTPAEHFDHVHWARQSRDGNAGVSGSATGVVSNWLLDQITALYDSITNPLRDQVGKLFPGDTLANRLPKDGTNAILDNVRSVLFSAADMFGLGPADMTPGAGVARWTPVVLQALAMLGQPASLLPVVLRRMQQESGGDANIVNNWDSNAMRGDPSVGLMQVIGSTYRAHADPRHNRGQRDPLSNILASMRYALSRYGSLAAAYNRPGGYAAGGTIPGRNRGRDDTLVLAQPGERVLTTEQNAWLESALRAASMSGAVSAVNRGSGLGSLVGASPASGERGPLIGEFHAHESVDVDRAVSRVAFLSGAP